MIRNLEMSLKPFWMIGMGALAGLLILAVLWLLLLLVQRRWAGTLLAVARERVVLPVLVVACGLALLAVSLTVSDWLGGRFYDQKLAALQSVLRLPAVGRLQFQLDVPAGETDQRVALSIPDNELKSLLLQSDQLLSVGINVAPSEAITDQQKADRLELLPGEPYRWSRGREPSGPLAGPVDAIYLTNETGTAAQVTLDVTTQPVVPEARVIPYTAIGLVAFVVYYLLLQLLLPKIAAVATTTGKEAVSQPLFFLTMAGGCVLLIGLVFTPYFTFGEDVKVYKDAGLQLIMILTLVIAIWTASVSLADEIEGRTALTVLSKPISRQQFVLGKYFGIVAPVLLQFVLLGTLFLLCISYKVVYDGRESGNFYVIWQDCFAETIHTVPGLVLAFMETIVLAAISVAISTRLPMLANLTICLAIYVVGHLVPLFVQSSVGEFTIVQFMGQLFATILPVLENFNVYAAVAAGQDVPTSYLWWVAGYSAIYITIAMLLALALFDDRDLA